MQLTVRWYPYSHPAESANSWRYATHKSVSKNHCKQVWKLLRRPLFRLVVVSGCWRLSVTVERETLCDWQSWTKKVRTDLLYVAIEPRINNPVHSRNTSPVRCLGLHNHCDSLALHNHLMLFPSSAYALELLWQKIYVPRQACFELFQWSFKTSGRYRGGFPSCFVVHQVVKRFPGMFSTFTVFARKRSAKVSNGNWWWIIQPYHLSRTQSGEISLPIATSDLITDGQIFPWWWSAVQGIVGRRCGFSPSV